MEQKQSWIKNKNEIDRLLKMLNQENVRNVVEDMFKINLHRFKGVVIRQIMKTQLDSHLNHTPILTCLVSILNSKIDKIGRILIQRLILQFKLNYLENNYQICKWNLIFMSNLVKFQVMDEIVILQILQLLLKQENNFKISLAVDILRCLGGYLFEYSNFALNLILDKLRNILQDGNLQLTKYNESSIKYLLQLNRSKFKSIPSKIEKQLDLVHDEDKITHDDIALDDEGIKSYDYLNHFRQDEKFDENDEKYQRFITDLFPTEEQDLTIPSNDIKEDIVTDMTESDTLQTQKLVYLTIMSSMSSDEAVHKLLKLSNTKQISDNQVLIDMILKCCSQEKTYSKFFSQIGVKFVSKSPKWHNLFVKYFKHYYDIISNFDNSQQVRNLGLFFGHLFSSDLIDLSQAWNELKLNEESTNPAKRIMLKFIFQEMIEELGVNEVKERLVNDDYLKPYINGLFPVVDVSVEDIDDLRFSINFFTAIGLGVLTDEMRSVLTKLEEEEEEEEKEEEKEEGEFEEEEGDRGRSRHRSNSQSRSDGSNQSFSRSRSGSKSRAQSFSRSPSPNNQESRRKKSETQGIEDRETFSRTPSRELYENHKRKLSRTPSRESFNGKKRNLTNILHDLN